MMSAILGTLYWEEVPNSAVVFVVLRAAAGLQIDRTPVLAPGTAPGTFPDCTNDRALGTVLQPSSPQASQAPYFAAGAAFRTTHFLTKKLSRTSKGSGPRKRRARPSRGLCPAPRAASGAEQHRPLAALPRAQRPLLRPPGPRTLQSTATALWGMMSASSLLLGSPFLASFWARAELNVTFTMARSGAPSEGGGGLGTRAAGSWLRLQLPRPGSEHG